MRLYALSVLFKCPSLKTKKLHATYELSTFGYFQRSSIQEFMDFTSKILVERTEEGKRTSVGEQEYMCHVYVRTDGLSAVLISDQEYPQRVAFSLLNKVLEEFSAKYPEVEWQPAKENGMPFPPLQEFLQKFQNPSSGDALTKLQGDVDETKIILHRTLEAVLDRGEKLDDLVNKSEELSLHSKAFYKTAKKTNSCCTLL